MSILQRQELDALRKLTQAQEEKIHALTTETKALSAVIHRDNKIVPAMEHAVRTYLESPEPQRALGDQLLAELHNMTADRKGILQAYETQEQKIPLTGQVELDTVLTYMHQRAKSLGVRFNATVSDFRPALSRQKIDLEDAKTILADLIENAVLACASSERKTVLVHIGTVKNRFLIRVFDSGRDFEVQALDTIGRTRITTRADQGGSGIGTETLFQLKEKYKASIILTESTDSPGVFSKNISFIFNQLDQFILQSDRAELLRSTCKRKDMLIRKNPEPYSALPQVS